MIGNAGPQKNIPYLTSSSQKKMLMVGSYLDIIAKFLFTMNEPDAEEEAENCDEENKTCSKENKQPIPEEQKLSEITNTFEAEGILVNALNPTKISKNLEKIAFVGKNCHQAVIEKVLKSENWKVPDNNIKPSKFQLKWVKSCLEIDYNSLAGDFSQLVNHIANISLLTNKRNLAQIIRDTGNSVLNSYLPSTYRMDVLSDSVYFLKNENDGVWILKPENRSKVKGIQIITDLETFKADFVKTKKISLGTYGAQEIPGRLEKIKKSIETLPNKESKDSLNIDYIIQKYQQDTLLIEKRRFNLKFFVLISSVDPLAFFYQPAYIVRCIEDCDLGNIQECSLLSITNFRSTCV
mgnify:FL=1